MERVGYYNGEIGPLEEMKVPMLDRAVYFGDGCYEATTFANNRLFALKEHLDRFENSCRMLKIRFDMRMSREELAQELQKCVDACDTDHGMLYWQCSRGTAPRGHQFPAEDVKPNLMAFVVPKEMVPMDQAAYKLMSQEDIRFFMCNVKTLNLLPSVLAFEACVEAGCQETVMYRLALGQKRVTECAHSNVCMLRNGELIVPPLDNLILPGITMRHLMMLAKQNGIPVHQTPFTLEELAEADEVIVSSSTALCIRAMELDGKPVGCKDEKTIRLLQQAYREYYQKETCA